jgi:hypothetical protein
VGLPYFNFFAAETNIFRYKMEFATTFLLLKQIYLDIKWNLQQLNNL